MGCSWALLWPCSERLWVALQPILADLGATLNPRGPSEAKMQEGETHCDRRSIAIVRSSEVIYVWRKGCVTVEPAQFARAGASTTSQARDSHAPALRARPPGCADAAWKRQPPFQGEAIGRGSAASNPYLAPDPALSTFGGRVRPSSCGQAMRRTSTRTGAGPIESCRKKRHIIRIMP